MTDLPAQIKIRRLQAVVDWLSSVVYGIAGGASGIGRISNYIALRAQNAITLQYQTVFVLADINGNAGLFSYDSGSVEPDDGVNVIVDLASRRWVRVGSPI